MERAIARMSQSICDLLEGSMQALYLYGSVTMGDFQPGWSDIDLVCFASSALADAPFWQRKACRLRPGL